MNPYRWLIFAISLLLTGCGFHLQGEVKLPPQFKSMHLQATDPYGSLAHQLQQSLKMSGVTLTSSKSDADTILIISQDNPSQQLLSVSGTQQTRQYQLSVSVTFEVTDKNGALLVSPQTLSDSRIITIQSNQILGSSNEANLYYHQIRRSLANAIMYRLGSIDVKNQVNENQAPKSTSKKSKASS